MLAIAIIGVFVVKVKIIKGVMIDGDSVFPTRKNGKKTVETIVEISAAKAKTLIASSQAERVSSNVEVTYQLVKLKPEMDKLDEFFGGDDEEKEDGED